MPAPDDVDEFFATADKTIPAPLPSGDVVAAQLDEMIAASTAVPLDFDEGASKRRGMEAVEMPDAFSPTLSGACYNPALLSCQTPTPVATVAVQLGEVTQQVQHLEIAESSAAPRRLFCDKPAPLLGQPPSKRGSAPPKV